MKNKIKDDMLALGCMILLGVILLGLVKIMPTEKINNEIANISDYCTKNRSGVEAYICLGNDMNRYCSYCICGNLTSKDCFMDYNWSSMVRDIEVCLQPNWYCNLSECE